MRTFFMAILGFVIGSVGSVFVLFLAYILFTVVTDFHDFEGATAMGMASFVAPVVALAGGIGGAVLLPQMTRPRNS
jgi:hypothetical protein